MNGDKLAALSENTYKGGKLVLLNRVFQIYSMNNNYTTPLKLGNWFPDVLITPLKYISIK